MVVLTVPLSHWLNPMGDKPNEWMQYLESILALTMDLTLGDPN
jgi:hypothetical protein